MGGIAGAIPRTDQLPQPDGAELSLGAGGLTTAPSAAGAAAACPALWLPVLVAAAVDGDWLGEVLGLPVGEGLGELDGDPPVPLVDGLGLGDELGLPEGELVGEVDGVVQLGDADGDPV